MLLLTAVRKDKLALQVDDLAGDGHELHLVLLRRFSLGPESRTHKHGSTLRYLIFNRNHGYCRNKTAGVDLNRTLKHFERVCSVGVNPQLVLSASNAASRSFCLGFA